LERDRLLNILRWVVTPIALAVIAGYFQSRVNIAKEQTRASYETLAPNVLELQDKLAKLTGRLEELSKRPAPCTETPAAKVAGKPIVRIYTPEPAAKVQPASAPRPDPIGFEGKTDLMMDGAPDLIKPPSPKKVPARFDDMLQQQEKSKY